MKTIIIGAGGHARVVYEICQHDFNIRVDAFIDNTTRGSDEEIMGIPVDGPHSVVEGYIDRGVQGVIIAVGDNDIRRGHFDKFVEMGLTPVNAVHHNAHISPSAVLESGIVVQSSAEVMTNVEVGDNSIINTGVIVEHETTIGNHVHIGPGTTIAGRVDIGDGAFIGMGCDVKEHVTVGEGAVVGAGSVVLEDVPSNSMVAGLPAEVKKRDKNE